VVNVGRSCIFSGGLGLEWKRGSEQWALARRIGTWEEGWDGVRINKPTEGVDSG